jgi:hypothetical protein
MRFVAIIARQRNPIWRGSLTSSFAVAPNSIENPEKLQQFFQITPQSLPIFEKGINSLFILSDYYFSIRTPVYSQTAGK